LVLDLTNFSAWIDAPMNARAEVDHRVRDGTRVAVFALSEQNQAKTLHTARMLTVLQTDSAIDIAVDESRLRIWTRRAFPGR